MSPLMVGLLSLGLSSGAAAAWLAWKSRVAARRRHRAAQQAYRLASELADEGFYVARPVTGADGAIRDWVVMDCNEQGAAFLGMSKHALVGRSLSQLCTGPTFENMLAVCAQAVRDGYYEDQHETMQDSPLQVRWVRRKLLASGSRLSATLRDISTEKSHAAEMARLAHEDAITALPNRQWLAEFLPPLLAQMPGRIALLYIDVDDFRNVNETLGHSVGDLLLRAAALRLTSVVGSGDKVVRLGGDEFAIVLTTLGSQGEAARVAELVNEILRFPLELVKGKSSITASIGISIGPDDGTDMATLLKSAEIAMYSAKRGGKGRYRFYDSTLSRDLQTKVTLEWTALGPLDTSGL